MNEYEMNKWNNMHFLEDKLNFKMTYFYWDVLDPKYEESKPEYLAGVFD